MKSLLLVICCLASSFVFSQKDVPQVMQLMKDQEQAWNNGDIPSFMKHYWQSDSLKFIGSKGITYGWQKTLDNYLKSYPNKEAMGLLKFTIIEATQLSKTAIYVVGKWALNKDKPVNGHYTLLWRKINKQWVIVADHTS